MKLVIPTTTADFPILQANVANLFRNLPVSEVIVVGSAELESLIVGFPNLKFYDESNLVNISEVKRLISNRHDESKAIKRTGWYVQQFLKMAFSRVCEDDYYLLWDSDTIPVKPIELFDSNGKPYLDYKTEYFKEYFVTMGRILPGYSKTFKGSFIAEHMLVNTMHMRELLNIIESNNSIEGTTFVEKIINSIPPSYIGKSGFSEFETFGTYLYKNYISSYTLRRWFSMRRGGYFYDASNLFDKRRQSWLSKSFHAISFEKGDVKNRVVSKVINSSLYMWFFTSSSLYAWAFVIRGIRKIKELL